MGNRFFVPAKADATLKLWQSKGLKMIQDLYLTDSDIMMSFEELRLKFSLNMKHFFKYLLIRSFVKANQDNVLIRSPHSSLEKIMIKDNLRKGIISEFYGLLTSHSSENSQYKLREGKLAI